jgi:cell wall-associated NlpC family hydrolase
MTQKFLYIFILPFLFTIGACSNVKVALYDKNKRQEVAMESKKAFENSPEAKEMTFRNSVVETAYDQLGTRYKYGSTDPKQGFDCSGLVNYVGRKHELTLPRSSTALAAAAPHIPWNKAEPGDLVFFGDKSGIDHVAIVEKNKKNELWVIHSTNKKGVYREDVLVSPYWKKRILFASSINSYLPARQKS